MNQTFLIKHLLIPSPPQLFHFTSKIAEGIIRSTQQIRLTKFDRSNDIDEFSFGLGLIRECLKEFKNKDEIKEVFIEKFLVFFEEEIKHPTIFFYMICFCQTHKNTYLNRYYAKKDGSLLLFNFSNQDFSGKAGLLAPVKYSRKVFKRKISKGLVDYYNFMRTNLDQWNNSGTYDVEMQNLMLALIRDLFASASFIKKHKFSPEREYRMILWGTDHNNQYMYLGLNPGVLA